MRRLAIGLLALILAYLAILSYPRPFFAHYQKHGPFRIWSDRPIDPAMTRILDDAARRIGTSELHTPDQEFRIFLCNEPWRLALFSQSFSARMGGVADGWLTGNIYLREADIPANRIIPPEGELADPEVRPLSYFIAHEATHVMQSRAFGRLVVLRNPSWLIEGYADYVGKGGDFDFDENLRMLKAGHRSLDPARSGLYRRHHLLVTHLLDREGRTVREVFADPPEERQLLKTLRGN